jgi:putative DNA primase/helicase
MVRHWHEIAGYSISHVRSIPVILVLYGEGSNGKTKLQETVMRLMGNDLVAAVRVESLEGRFAIGGLLGKKLLVDDDVRSGLKLPDGELKKLSEEKLLTGEHKFGPPFNFTNRAFAVLICNGVPSLGDISYGMLRRLMVIPFLKKFKGKADNKRLFFEIWTNEMSGVLNRAIEGLARVLRRGVRFDRPPSVERAQAEWLRYANPLASFVAERCVRDPLARCPVEMLYQSYRDWASENGVTLVQQKNTMSRNLSLLGYKAKHGRQGTVILGLKLRSAWEGQPDRSRTVYRSS